MDLYEAILLSGKGGCGEQVMKMTTICFSADAAKQSRSGQSAVRSRRVAPWSTNFVPIQLSALNVPLGASSTRPVESGTISSVSLDRVTLDRRGSGASFLMYKVLRLWKDRFHSLSLQSCTNRDFPWGNALAVQGDALIHGPTLVARPVGSEWRTRRPRCNNIQNNQLTGDRTL
jgi:hypothetical protein